MSVRNRCIHSVASPLLLPPCHIPPVLPGSYRIRVRTDKERGMPMSKEVKARWEHEEALLASYEVTGAAG